MVFRILFSFFSLTLASAYGNAERMVVTPDGQQILLKDDYTWEVVQHEQRGDAGKLELDIVRILEERSACRIRLRLTNNLKYEVKSLIPFFTAYIANDVKFETVSKEFYQIKPGRSQNRGIRFPRIRCDEIAYVQMSVPDRCTVGELDKFSGQSGVCLGLVHINKNEHFNLTKNLNLTVSGD